MLHRLLAFAAPLGDLGEALDVAAPLDRGALALAPLEAGREPLLGLVDQTEAKRQAAPDRVGAAPAEYPKLLERSWGGKTSSAATRGADGAG